MTEYERVRRNYEMHEAYVAKKYAKAFEIGRATLKKEPENFYVLALLTQAGYDNAQSDDASLNEESIGYARAALALAEKELPRTDPFASIEDARGFLNFALGWFLRTQSPVEAAGALTKAAKSGSKYKDDPLVYNLLGIAILKGEYAQLAADYNTKFGNKPPSPEQQAMWDQIAKLGGRAIDALRARSRTQHAARASGSEEQNARPAHRPLQKL